MVIYNKSFEERFKESASVLQKYPSKVPVIVYRSSTSLDIPDLKKNKFLVPRDFTVGQFIYLIRSNIKLPSHKSMFIFVNNSLPTTSTLISTLYQNYKDNDGFLYMVYTGESTFG